MKKFYFKQAAVLMLLITIVGLCETFAQAPELRTSTRQVRTTLDRIRTKTATLQREITRVRYDNINSNVEERVYDQLTALSNAASSMRSRTFSSSRYTDVSDELNGILDRGSRINRILDRNRPSGAVMSQWTSLRYDINTLAGYYGVAWNWNDNGSGFPNGGNSYALTGTFRINNSRSDNVSDVIDRQLNYYSSNQRDDIRRRLERRLASPDVIAIEKSGRTVTLGSSNQSQVVLDADGRARSETNDRGRRITTRVTSTGNNLTIDYSGDRVNDYNVNFAIDSEGRLRVTRRIYLENRNDQITVSSVYDRINSFADWSMVRRGNDTGSNTTGDFYVANGTLISARLRNDISTRNSQVGDRFTMEVTSPDRYRGATLEGRISEIERSGRISGRANVVLDFETITINGRSYQFEGLVQSVNTANGDSVSVNNEGSIRDRSQTTRTATRTGVGAVVGAIIGAIAGGGSGAAIGAGVGAGAGAGTVLIGGRDNIEIGSGSTFSISASSPTNIAVRN